MSSGILALPREMLGPILMLAIVDPLGSDIQQILNVALVSRQWHSTVLTEREIWTSFAVKLDEETDWAKVRSRYRRAGDLPLTLRLFEPPKSKLDSPGLVAIDFICSIDRWERIIFSIQHGDHTHQRSCQRWCSSFSGTWPHKLFEAIAKTNEATGRNVFAHLRNLDFDFEMAEVGVGPINLDDSFLRLLAKIAPQLKSLRIGEALVQKLAKKSALGKHLTRLAIYGTFTPNRPLNLEPEASATLINALSLLPNLQYLDWEIQWDSTPLSARPHITTPVEHRNLKELKVTFCRKDVDNSFREFGRIRCPSLRRLSLYADTMMPADDSMGRSIQDMILLSHCPLETLVLMYQPLRQDALFTILLGLPTLKSLQIGEIRPEWTWNNGELFKKLYERSQWDSVLPNLEELGVRHECEQPLLAEFQKFVQDPKRWYNQGWYIHDTPIGDGNVHGGGNGKVTGRFSRLKKVVFLSNGGDCAYIRRDEGVSIRTVPDQR